MNMQDFFEKIKTVSFNAIDVLIFVLAVFPSLMLLQKYDLLNNRFVGINLVIFYLFCFYFYIYKVREKIFKIALIKYITPQELPEEYKGRFSLLNLLIILMTYLGALGIILSAYFGIANQRKPITVTEHTIELETAKRIERKKTMGFLSILETAEEVSEHDMKNAKDLTSFEELNEKIDKANLAEEERIRKEVQEELTKQAEEENLRNKKRHRSLFVRNMSFCFILFLLGAVLDKIYNLIILKIARNKKLKSL